MNTSASDKRYEWVNAFETIANWIVDYEDRQEELVDVLIEAGVKKIGSIEHNGEEKDKLKIMDPFSFLFLIVQSNNLNRRSILQNVLKYINPDELKLSSFDYLPTYTDSKVYAFPDPKFASLRTPEMISNLWSLFYEVREQNIRPSTVEAILAIPGTSWVTLTYSLFLASPDDYLPMNSRIIRWLSKNNIETSNLNWDNYQSLLTEIRKITDKPFWQIYDEASNENGDDSIVNATNTDKEHKEATVSLNRILYGPPGTGKTYETTELAVQCVAPEWYAELTNQYPEAEGYSVSRREKLKAKYDELTDMGRIAFTTFHQSFAYEDFIEGIRAKTDEKTKQIYYDIEDGVFKDIAIQTANTVTRNNIEGLAEKPKFWKISLGDSEQNELRQYCFKNGEARIGWGYTGDLNKNLSERSPEEKDYLEGMGSNDRSSIRDFSENMQVGDVLLCLKDKDTLRAIGIVTSDYDFDTSFKGLEEFHHTRKVNWILKDMSFDIYRLNNYKHLAQKTCYKIDRFTWDELAEELDRQGYSLDSLSIDKEITEKENYILIIDEINRGNISRIFGELITLLEPDKRRGGSDAREVTLPYSKDKFSVPSNLYVLGTMNTADKSLAQLDLALRRRFEFIELLPNPSLLDDITIYGEEISKILTTMNARIEVLLDREHTIGHSYFWKLKDLQTEAEKEVELANIFEKRIIPLLQEYFFSDWERIGWVLNDPKKNSDERFIQTEDLSPKLSELFSDDIKRLVNDRRYKINKDAFSNPQAYKKILMSHAQSSESSDSQE